MEQRKPVRPVPTLRKAFRSIAFPTGACWRATLEKRSCCWCNAAMTSFAVGATCTHYGGPLATAGGRRHRAVSLASRLFQPEDRRGPARSSIQSVGMLESRAAQRQTFFVQHKQELLEPHRTAGATPAGSPAKIVIVGGGAAGFAAAEKLRRERYEGDLVMVSGEEVPPVDRPNLSKDYLAGKARRSGSRCGPPASIPKMASICDLARTPPASTCVPAKSYSKIGRGGIRPAIARNWCRAVRLSSRGGAAACAHVAVARRLSRDHRAAAAARRTVVLGASFIGLEVAAALRRAISRYMW